MRGPWGISATARVRSGASGPRGGASSAQVFVHPLSALVPGAMSQYEGGWEPGVTRGLSEKARREQAVCQLAVGGSPPLQR